MVSSYRAFSAPEKITYSKEASEALGADHWLVTEGFSFYIGKKEEEKWVHVPAGYLTDGASVPRPLWAVIPPWGPWGQAAIVHDYLCEYLSITVKGRPVHINRVYADLIFLEAMIALEVPEIQRKMIYSAVRAYTAVVSDGKPSNTAVKRELESRLMVG